MRPSVEIKDYIVHNPVKTTENADLFEAVELILAHKISGICVVNEQNDLVGVLSELDCLSAVLSALYEDRTNVGLVKDYMTTAMYTASVNDDIIEVASDMLKNSHRRPVVKDGKLVGLVTCRQLLRAIRDFSKKK